MAFDFPSSPTTGQSYQGYTWDGEKWTVAATGGAMRRYIYTATAGQVTFTGSDSAGQTLTYAAGGVEVSVNGIWVPYSDYTATNGTSIVLNSACAAGDVVYVFALSNFSVLDPFTAKKNYVLNGAMMVSQENGTTAVTVSGSFPVDQWRAYNGSSGTFSAAQAASVSPAGSPNRFRYTVTAADAAVAAGDFAGIDHQIEGLRSADLMWGTANAKTITIRFGCKAPAGTYCIGVRNASPNYSYVAEYTISAGEANIDVVKSVTLPGPTGGSWFTDTNSGLSLFFTLMCGTTYQQAAGSWQAANKFATSNQFNLMGTNGNVFELFDVSLTEGVTAPPYVVPDYASELALCMRYYWKHFPNTTSATFGAGIVFSATIAVAHVNFPVPMRAAPTLAASAAGAFYVLASTAITPSAVAVNSPTTLGARLDCTISGGTGGQGMVLNAQTSAAFLAFNARL